jgi:hypothetical protein
MGELVAHRLQETLARDVDDRETGPALEEPVGADFDGSNSTTLLDARRGDTLPSPSTDNDTLVNAGSAYIFFRNGTQWSTQAYLKSPNREDNDVFGYAADISGNLVAVGTWSEDSNQTSITNASSGTLPSPSTDDDSALNAGVAYVFIAE